MDMEKVIKGLERCSKHDGSECPQCPYFNGECTDDLMADALALLNQQENDIHHMGLIIDEYEKELKKQETKQKGL